jgi:hypothetical protein
MFSAESIILPGALSSGSAETRPRTGSQPGRPGEARGSGNATAIDANMEIFGHSHVLARYQDFSNPD